MKKIYLITKITMPVIFLLLMVAGCAKKSAVTGSISTDLLKYRFEENSPLSYANISTMEQTLIYMGQENSAVVENIVAFQVKKDGESEGKLDINIKVDSIFGVVRSMQGDMVSNPQNVRGASFNMKLTDRGKESGLEEAAAITYKSVAEQESNLKITFELMFPDLPDGATGIGYTWTDLDTIDMSAGEMSTLMIINSANTIESKEKFGGYDCYKVSYQTSGERTASGNTVQGYMTSSGTITGSGYFYFAPEEGIIVGDYSVQKFDGEITIPTGESIPMYMDINIKTELTGK